MTRVTTNPPCPPFRGRLDPAGPRRYAGAVNITRRFIAALFASALLLPVVTAAAPARAPRKPAAVDPALLAPKIPAVVATPLPGDLLGATVHRLSNGLTVYLSVNRAKPRITSWIAVRAGSRHDPADATGLAHYLEHMLFKGSERLGTLDYRKEKVHLDRITALYDKRFKTTDPVIREQLYRQIDQANAAAGKFAIPNELDRLYNQLGFDGVNAFTMDEGTVYICDFPKNRAGVWAALEADRFTRPVFRLFPGELETVYEEKNRSLDHPERALFEGIALALYPNHPYGTQPTLGTVEHLKNPSLTRVREYYRAHYVPNNMCVALAGDFEPAEMLALLERTLGAWKPAPVPAPVPSDLTPPAGTKRVEFRFEAEEKVVIAWPAVRILDPDMEALRVMDMLMDNARTGIINLTLVQQQRVKSAGSWNDFQNEAGSWTAWAVPKAGQTLEEAEALLLGAVDALKAGKFDEADIRAIMTSFEVGEKQELESAEGRVVRMANSFLQYEEWERTSRWIERLRAVTKADVVRVANRYLGPDRVIAYRRNGKPELPAIAKPELTKLELDPSKSSAFFRELVAMPAAPIEPRWVVSGSDFTVSARPFGTLYATPNRVNDVFTLAIGFGLGTRDRKELGAAYDLLELAGAGALDAEAFRKALFALGVSLSYSVDERWMAVGLSGLEANLEAALKLLFEQVAKPRIEAGTLDKMVQVAIGAHADNRKNPGYVMHALREFAQRGTESTVLLELSDRELKGLKQDRLVALAREPWQYPADVRYVGTRTPEEVAALYARLAPKATKPRPARRTIEYLKPVKTRVLFAHREMVQAQVSLAAPDGVWEYARRADYAFYQGTMGGSMSSIIFQEIREARALAYAAGGGYAEGHRQGDENRVTAGLGTQADKTIEATALLIELVRAPPLSAERFTETKQAVLEGYRTNPIGFREIPDAVLGWVEKGLPPEDPRPATFARCEAYTLEDLTRFATRFKTTPFTISMLGSRDRVDIGKLKDLGEFEEVSLDNIFPY